MSWNFCSLYAQRHTSAVMTNITACKGTQLQKCCSCSFSDDKVSRKCLNDPTRSPGLLLDLATCLEARVNHLLESCVQDKKPFSIHGFLNRVFW